MRLGFSDVLFGGCLFTLPWVGMGVIHFFTGRDLGGGLQPSWVFLAFALTVLTLKSSPSVGFFRSGLIFKRLPPPLVLITLGTFGAVLFSALGIFWAPSLETLTSGTGRWAKQLVQLVIMFSFFWWATLWVRGTRRWQFTLDFLFLGAAFQVFYSLFQGMDFYLTMPWFSSFEKVFTSNPSILSGSERLYLNNVLQEIPRFRGTVCEPLYLGNYLLMVWPFLLVWRRPLIVKLFMGSFLLLLLLLTWSRGAWLGGVGQFFLIGVFFLTGRIKNLSANSSMSPRKKRKYLPLVLTVLVLSLPAVDHLTGGLIFHRLSGTFNNQDWSNLTRLYSMKAAWLAFLQSPVVGIGWGQFAFHFPLLVDPMGLQSQFSWPVVNNFPLQILCETGSIGFITFIGSGFLLFLMVRRRLSANFRSITSMSMVFPAAVGVWGVWIQMLSFSQYNLPHIWIGLGLLLSALVEFPVQARAEENRETP